MNKYLVEIGTTFRGGDQTSLEDFDLSQIAELYDYFRERVGHFVRRRRS